MLPDGVWWNILNFLDCNELITLLYVSKNLRFFVLQKFRTYWKLSSGFCSFDQWDEKLTQNFFDLLNSLYLKLYECLFDFEYYILKLEALSDFDVTLKDEEKLLGYVYNYASQTLMDFWDCNAFFFYYFFLNFPSEFKETICFRVE